MYSVICVLFGPWVPDNFYVGGGPTETTISILAGILLAIAIGCVLLLPRKRIIAPVLLILFLVPLGNVLVVGGLHLMTIRIISLFGWIRLTNIKLSSRTPLFVGRMNSVDIAFTLCTIFHVLAFVLLWQTSSAVVNQCGYLWSELGMYFYVRYLIQDEADSYQVMRTFAVVAAVCALEMVYEQARGQNLFGTIVGGISTVPEIREGRIRSQGSFGHAILAGTYGATMLPLFWCLLKNKISKVLGAVGLLASLVMVATCASSTPILALVAGVVALCCWPIRKYMRWVRWGIVATIVSLHLVMKAPVWFLIARVDVTGSSSGYHRAELVNLFITRLSDWWLFGTKSNGSWDYAMFDTSNMYVGQGESGGLLAFVFFIYMICKVFSRAGKARHAFEGNLECERLIWYVSCSLFATIVAFFGISYWDQMNIGWFALLGMASACSAAVLSPKNSDSAEEISWGSVKRRPNARTLATHT